MFSTQQSLSEDFPRKHLLPMKLFVRLSYQTLKSTTFILLAVLSLFCASLLAIIIPAPFGQAPAFFASSTILIHCFAIPFAWRARHHKSYLKALTHLASGSFYVLLIGFVLLSVLVTMCSEQTPAPPANSPEYVTSDGF